MRPSFGGHNEATLIRGNRLGNLSMPLQNILLAASSLHVCRLGFRRRAHVSPRRSAARPSEQAPCDTERIPTCPNQRVKWVNIDSVES